MAVTAIATESLYQRLGERESIAEVVNGLYERLINSSDSWYHWKGRSYAQRENEVRSFMQIVCAAAGGPVKAEGLEKSDTTLDIKKVEWNTFVPLAAETLDETGFDVREKEEFYSLLTKAKGQTGDNHDRPSHATVFAAFPHALTHREREVLTLIALGRNNSEIAGELYISINTVTRHVTNIFTKTSTKNRVEAAVYAAKRHLV